jgi:hypothetical protein
VLAEPRAASKLADDEGLVIADLPAQVIGVFRRAVVPSDEFVAAQNVDLITQRIVDDKRVRVRVVPLHGGSNQTGRGAGAVLARCHHQGTVDAQPDRDLEGIVAKWKYGRYVSGPETSWVKNKNPAYSQIQGRREQFEKMRQRAAAAGK